MRSHDDHDRTEMNADERHWVRVALAERGSDDALDAVVLGARRRARNARLRALLGRTDRVATPAPRDRLNGPGTTPEARAATLVFLDDRAVHSEEEDLHPADLDPHAAALQRALEDVPRDAA